MGCHFFLQCVKVKSFSRVQLLVTPWTAAYQAPLSLGFSRQEYWTGVPSPSPRIEDRVTMNFSCGQCPRWCSGKKFACNAGDTGDLGLIPGLGRAPGEGKRLPNQYSGLENSKDSPWSHKKFDMTGEGNGTPLQYSCLENPMDGGAW